MERLEKEYSAVFIDTLVNLRSVAVLARVHHADGVRTRARFTPHPIAPRSHSWFYRVALYTLSFDVTRAHNTRERVSGIHVSPFSTRLS